MVSGMLAGTVLAVVREGNFGAVGFMVVVFVYGWWILSFGLTAYQRVFATIIMIAIGFYGPELGRAAFQR